MLLDRAGGTVEGLRQVEECLSQNTVTSQGQGLPSAGPAAQFLEEQCDFAGSSPWIPQTGCREVFPRPCAISVSGTSEGLPRGSSGARVRLSAWSGQAGCRGVREVQRG
jgi:hypothetical protein